MKNRLDHAKMGLKREKGLLLLCLGLAFLAWQGIRKNIGFEVLVSNVSVDVEVPDGWAVWEKSFDKVDILFRGSREDIRYLNNEQLRVVVPVSDPKRENEITVKFSEKYLQNITDAKVVRFNPPEIRIKLDQESERLLPIKAAVSGSLPEGLEVDRIVCTPATVRVSGARQVLDKMVNVQTKPIDLENRQTSFKESIPVALPRTERMSVDPDWVSVELVLVERSSMQLYDNVDVRILTNPDERRDIHLNPSTINISVKGLQNRLEKLGPSDIFAYVNCSDLVENIDYDLPVIIDLPSGLHLLRAEPAAVRVRIGK